jgi:hypothetical protein
LFVVSECAGVFSRQPPPPLSKSNLNAHKKKKNPGHCTEHLVLERNVEDDVEALDELVKRDLDVLQADVGQRDPRDVDQRQRQHAPRNAHVKRRQRRDKGQRAREAAGHSQHKHT